MFEQSNILSTGTRLMNNHDACAFVSLNLLRLGSLGQLIHNSHNNIPIIEIEISAIRSTHVSSGDVPCLKALLVCKKIDKKYVCSLHVVSHNFN